jgi:serine/threonine protein kinase
MDVQRASTCPKCGRVFIEGERLCPFDAAPVVVPPADTKDPLIGSVVNRSYVVLSKLGEGGMGVVYKALQQRLERQVALKVLGPRFGGDVKASERFRHEARAVSQLTNPHTVTVYDFGSTEDGTLYLAMQLLKGESLRERMARLPLTPQEAVSIAADICDSLAEAHERVPQIIHRDIKPDNIFVRVTETGTLFATVLDFGLARIQDSAKLTASNSVIGTVAYMAPEQAQSRKDVDGRLDLYALGVMLFEMLAGRVPFDSPDKLGVMYKHVYNPPPALRDVRRASGANALPGSLEALVAELLAKQPAQRPPSARAVRGRLMEIMQELGGLPQLAVPSLKPSSLPPRPPPRPNAPLQAGRIGDTLTTPRAGSKPAPPAKPPTAPKPAPPAPPAAPARTTAARPKRSEPASSPAKRNTSDEDLFQDPYASEVSNVSGNDEISEDDEPTVVRRPPSAPPAESNTEPDTDPEPLIHSQPAEAQPPGQRHHQKTAIRPRITGPNGRTTSAMLAEAGMAPASKRISLIVGAVILVAAIAAALLLITPDEPAARPMPLNNRVNEVVPAAAPAAPPGSFAAPVPPPGAAQAPTGSRPVPAGNPAPATAENKVDTTKQKPKKPARKKDELDDEMRQYLHR